MPRLVLPLPFLRGLSFAAAVLVPLALWLSTPNLADSQSQQSLQGTISSSKTQEARLGSAAARLDRLIGGLARSIGALQARENDVQLQLNTAQARLTGTRTNLRAERAHLQRLRARLVVSRRTLADQLAADYTSSQPSVVDVVIASTSFADLLEKAEFYKRVARSSANVIDAVRDAKVETRRETVLLARLEVQRVATVETVTRQRNALASMHALLASRQAALARARAVRLAALSAVRGRRQHAEGELKKLEDAQARAAVSQAGPGGPWAIPWAVVQCESGGQNLPPNSATASGYYQFIDSTWHALGGSTPKAYLAPKAEQDRLAARLWAGGSGARNWDCASIVGII